MSSLHVSVCVCGHAFSSGLILMGWMRRGLLALPVFSPHTSSMASLSYSPTMQCTPRYFPLTHTPKLRVPPPTTDTQGAHISTAEKHITLLASIVNTNLVKCDNLIN